MNRAAIIASGMQSSGGLGFELNQLIADKIANVSVVIALAIEKEVGKISGDVDASG